MKGDTMDTITKLHPYGRCPKGEPGYDFPRGEGPLAPIQKGTSIADQQKALVREYAQPPAWTDGGDYTVLSVMGERDGKPYTIDHACIGLRSGTLFAWFVQSDESYQGDAAMAIVGNLDWYRLVSPIAWIQEARAMLRSKMGVMFPEQEWAVVWIDDKDEYSFDGTKDMVKRFHVKDDGEN